jgi:hypothetical protein
VLLIPWAAALALGALAAWLAYGRGPSPSGKPPGLRRWLLVSLRAAAVALVAALLFGAAAGRATTRQPLVAIDRSASARRAAGDDSSMVRAWRSLLRDSLSRFPSDAPLVAIGDSLREATADEVGTWLPDDAASRVRPAVDRAAALGRSLVLFTDGEVDDAEALAEAPPGSRAVRWPSTPRPDVAVAELSVPSAWTTGDSSEVRATLTAGPVATGNGTLVLFVDGRPAGNAAVAALAPYASARISLPVVAPSSSEGVALVQAVLSVAGDVEPRNDTLAVAVDVGDRPSAVFVSTAPDLDVREVLTVLRGALDVPTRAYLRVAPGVWRVEGTLTPISEAEVRARAASAGMLIVHGDTTWKPAASASGATATATAAPLARALWVPAPPTGLARAGEVTRTPEWYLSGAPDSPLMAALSTLPFDSLPPITLAGPVRQGTPVLTAQLGKRGDAAAAVAIRESAGQRSVLVSGSGWAGWSLRAGRSREAFAALWGAIFDWLSAGRGDLRAARPVGGVLRAGEPVAWRRGGADTVVAVRLARRSSNAATRSVSAAATDSLVLRFSGAQFETQTPALPAGVYDVETAGGRSVLVVNASREWVPRVPAVQGGPLARGVAGSDAPRLADKSWPFVAALLLLCAEWLLRRASGQR